MVQKVSSLKTEGLSPSNCDSDPEEKEISEDDDDDRNHKHRRRDTQSLSTERDSVDQVLNRPNRKRNKPFENGNPFRENDFQSSEPWKRRPNRDNHPSSANFGPGRGRGMEISPWIHHNPRFNPAIGSPMVLPGPIPPNMGPTWGPYGLIPGVLNGGLDPLGLRPSINIPHNMGIMRQRCRDFEERGFCLRGDMCPMEHGTNRIVVEDVQSLSQFNLPVSLPSGHPLGSSSALPSFNTSNTTANNNNIHSKSGKAEITGLPSGSADASDFYDPDQPLWANNVPGTSTSFQGINSSKFDEKSEFCDGKIDHHDKNNKPVWGRVGSNNKPDIKGKFDLNKAKHSGEFANSDRSTPEEKIKLDALQPNMRKPDQKALRTLFVNCIPKEDNNIEALLQHFKKFGEIIDIYIPQSADRAFVQFSKKEEAEKALKAPDAVMGNRFIKLLWATRDRIPEDVPFSANSATLGPPRQFLAQKGEAKSGFPYNSVSHVPHVDSPKPVVQKKPGNLALLEEFRKRQESFAQKRDALQRELAKLEKKAAGSKGEVASEQVAKRQKVEVVADKSKAEALNSCDTGTKIASPQEETVADSVQVEALNSIDTGTEIASLQAETVAASAKAVALSSSEIKMAEKENSLESCVDKSILKPLSTVELQKVPSLKQSIRPLAPLGGPFGLNRYKLDNRPSAFRVSAPLPTGLENIDVLKEHFSSYGELTSVELEDGNSSDSSTPNKYSALIHFTNRRSAEKAFVYGRNWQGHTLQFVWINSSNSSNNNGNKEKPSKAEVSTTISAESVNLGNKDSNGECVEKGEDLRSSSSSVSGEL